MGVKGLLNKQEKLSDDEIIEKGAPVKADLKPGKRQWHNFTLRISTDMLQEVQHAVDNMVGISVTGFILQGIQEKLKRLE